MTTRNLLSGPITLSEAQGRDKNILHALQYPKQKEAFYERIEGLRPLLADAVAHHLCVKSAQVTISPQEHWLNGSFNLCVPVLVEADETTKTTVPKFVIIRFPLPYRVGEATNPGNSDEKINTEAATYAWLQRNCPEVPIPQLYGFGLSTNKRWTNLEFLPCWSRWFQRARRFFLAVFGFSQPSDYVHRCPSHLASLDIGYLLIETITSGEMLSSSWDEKHHDEKLQHNLQRDVARVMLSLAKIPLPRIGSFRIDDNGYVSLVNRPLSLHFAMQENEGVSVDLPRDKTFSTVDGFVLHRIAAHENRLLYQPNGISSYSDACYQMTSLAGAKSIFPQLFRRDLQDGPFAFALTDMHRSNILVDEEWNITRIIDLEFAASLPLEFLQTPYWLTGKLVDEVEPTEFTPIHNKFIEHLRREEAKLPGYGKETEPLSSVIDKAWSNGTFWAPAALDDSIVFTSTFYKRLLPDYFGLTEEEINNAGYAFFASLWRPNIHDIIERKMQDREMYFEKLRAVFAD